MGKNHAAVRVLGLFARNPVPGQVKTRLAATTTAGWAARVADAFVRDLVERLASFDARRVLGFTPAEARAYFADLAAGRFVLTPQSEGHLGDRMATFFDEQFATGAARVVLVGADSPTLPIAFLEKAFEVLDRADVVLGPATDGGYYLVGCAGRRPPIFDDLPWGSSRVLKATVARLPDPAWRLALLPPWYDVDTLADWQMLTGHLAALRRAGQDPGLPHTEQLAHEDPNPCP